MHNMMDLTSRECKAYLFAGGDLAVVPLGAVERLGPHLPLGARNMVVEAIARLLAEKNNGLCLPVIPYSTLYDTHMQQGSIDIEPELMHRYCYDLCNELTANKFKRIVFVSFQEELYYLGHEYFQDKNIAVAHLTPDFYFDVPDTTVASLDEHGREFWRFVGCLSAMENKKMITQVFVKTQQYFDVYEPLVNHGKRSLDLLGRTGHKMLDGEWRFYPVNLGKGLEKQPTSFIQPSQELIEKARDELIAWLDSLSPSFEDLSKYQTFLDRTAYNRPV